MLAITKSMCMPNKKAIKQSLEKSGEGFDPLYDALLRVWCDDAAKRMNFVCVPIGVCLCFSVCVHMNMGSISIFAFYMQKYRKSISAARIMMASTKGLRQTTEKWKKKHNTKSEKQICVRHIHWCHRSRSNSLSGINNQKSLQWDTVSYLFANHNKHRTSCFFFKQNIFVQKS